MFVGVGSLKWAGFMVEIFRNRSFLTAFVPVDSSTYLVKDCDGFACAVNFEWICEFALGLDRLVERIYPDAVLIVQNYEEYLVSLLRYR